MSNTTGSAPATNGRARDLDALDGHHVVALAGVPVVAHAVERDA